MANVVLVLLTDNRANVGLRADRPGVAAELALIATGVAAAGIRSLVTDTQRNFLSQGSAQRLAAALQGEYLYLPGASRASIEAGVRGLSAASARPDRGSRSG